MAVFLLSLVRLVWFCVFRFCAKKRNKKVERKKNQDEQGLVAGEEEVDILDEEPVKVGICKVSKSVPCWFHLNICPIVEKFRL